MKISHAWLQSYFKEKLPAPEKLTDLFTFHFAEVEGVERVGEDTVYDIKILPDRACYALSHRGVARELSAILNLPLHEEPLAPLAESDLPLPDIQIAAQELCTKFVSRRIEGVEVRESPEWLKRRLQALGQRSINNLVDATNYVMFDLGRPMHVFDADKVHGPLVVRSAHEGEVVVTLDGRRLTLNNNELVIADDEGLLGLAGIKGGKRGGVEADTKNIILEAANWNPAYIRRTATTTGVRTDASKRFENRLSPFLAEEGVERITSLILAIAATDATAASKPLVVSFEDVQARTILADPAEISRKLGITLAKGVIEDVLRRLMIPFETRDGALLLHIPPDRLDLETTDDIVEEVGRIVGYDQVPLVMPPPLPSVYPIPKSFYWEWKIRESLVSEGFSEVMTSSFLDTGEVAIEKPLAEDKRFARPALRPSFAAALAMNARNAPLFGSEETKIFEIGRVFRNDGEHTALALGYAGSKKKGADALAPALEKITAKLGIALAGETNGGVFECELDGVLAKLPEPRAWDMQFPPPASEKFQPFSLYPFISRDVALFVPAGTQAEDVLQLIRTAAGPLATRTSKFDEFTKDGRQSFGFRIVFQSPERTLTDEEANEMMEKVYAALKDKFQAEIR